MQDKHLFDDKDKQAPENEQTGVPADGTAEDGVVYVVNEDGTPFDISDRTYVAVEGLEGEVGSDDDGEKEDDKTTKE